MEKQGLLNAMKSLFSLLILIGTFLHLLLRWGHLPDRIPGHYNVLGEIDRWGSRSELLVLPIIVALLYVFMTIIESFPQIWNTGVTVTTENKRRVHAVLRGLLATEKLAIVALFAFLSVYQTTAQNLPSWFTPVSLAFVFGSLVFYITKLRRIK